MNKFRLEANYIEDHPVLEVDESDILYMCLYEMSNLELNYYILAEELIPVWDMVIANTRYFIDISTGEIIRDEMLIEE